jgi:hypothetical protein
MRKLFCRALCVGVVLGTFAFTLPLQAAIHDPGKKAVSWLARDGGDVLRPDRGGDGYHWYLGIDGGLTWSTFQNGPLAYYTSNPHNPRYVIPASVDGGNGIGFYLGATADFPVSDALGILLKLHYHSRGGVFDESTDLREIHFDTETGLNTVLRNETEWSFHYVGFDVLLRINLGDSGPYFMVGPSFQSLVSNSAKLDQSIVQPDDIFYYEDVNGFDDVVNFRREASSTEEVAGLVDFRIDVKAGFGWRIELSEGLQLVPELALAYPLTKLVDDGYTPDFAGDPAGVLPSWENSNEQTLIETNPDFNMMTVFFTVGLRWRIGS